MMENARHIQNRGATHMDTRPSQCHTKYKAHFVKCENCSKNVFIKVDVCVVDGIIPAA